MGDLTLGGEPVRVAGGLERDQLLHLAWAAYLIAEGTLQRLDELPGLDIPRESEVDDGFGDGGTGVGGARHRWLICFGCSRGGGADQGFVGKGA
jgi:hypothetical protein